MFPKISDLVNYVFGTSLSLPIPTWGFFTSLAFTAAAAVTWIEISRKHKLGQLPAPNTLQIIILAVLIIPITIIGSKLMSAMETPAEFFANPIRMLFTSGGMSYYGGFLGGFIAVIFYAKFHRIGIWYALDIAAIVIPLGYTFGRLGCHLSGDGCWGIQNTLSKPGFLKFLPDWAWGVTFPHNVAQQGVLIDACSGKYCHILPYPVFPTSLYEAAFSLLTFVMLWSFRKKLSPGILFAIFLIIYSAARFFIEFIRVNPKFTILQVSLSQAQYISIPVFITGVGILLFLYRKKLKLHQHQKYHNLRMDR
jgi:phosphatidylglycerol---prolipoprotein diacylglyceryl transferase